MNLIANASHSAVAGRRNQAQRVICASASLAARAQSQKGRGQRLDADRGGEAAMAR